MKKIAVVTSGGDAPGMNAAIRAVTRAGIAAGLEVYGVDRGFAGLIEDTIRPITDRDVSGKLQLGGTFLGTARSPSFKQRESQLKAIQNLKNKAIELLVVIGGNGSQKGAYALQQHGYKVVGIASTIDNDLYGSDISIGVDTALNTIIDSIDKIKTTAQSHERAFLVEVMGRQYGYLALMAGISGGAEVVITPEFEVEPAQVARILRQAYEQGKRYALVIVSEGAKNNAQTIAEYFKEHKQHLTYELKVTILGHVQRGGGPTVFDRLLASQMGAAAVDLITNNEAGKVVVFKGGDVNSIPLSEVVSNKKTLDMDVWKLGEVLAR